MYKVHYAAASMLCNAKGEMICADTTRAITVCNDELQVIFKSEKQQFTWNNVGWAYEQLAKLHKFSNSEYTVTNMAGGIKEYRVTVVKSQK